MLVREGEREIKEKEKRVSFRINRDLRLEKRNLLLTKTNIEHK